MSGAKRFVQIFEDKDIWNVRYMYPHINVVIYQQERRRERQASAWSTDRPSERATARDRGRRPIGRQQNAVRPEDIRRDRWHKIRGYVLVKRLSSHPLHEDTFRLLRLLHWFLDPAELRSASEAAGYTPLIIRAAPDSHDSEAFRRGT